jgi:hypothetical protein
MPRRLQVEQFGGSAGAMWFNETGSRRVFRWNGWWARPLRADVHLPGAMIPSGRWLFVLERNDLRPGAETIAPRGIKGGRVENEEAGSVRPAAELHAAARLGYRSLLARIAAVHALLRAQSRHLDQEAVGRRLRAEATELRRAFARLPTATPPAAARG